jgi:hypothetical protein
MGLLARKELFSRELDQLATRLLEIGPQGNIVELARGEIVRVIEAAGLSDSQASSCLRQIEASVEQWLRTVERKDRDLFSAVIFGRIAEIVGREGARKTLSEENALHGSARSAERIVVAIVPVVDAQALTKQNLFRRDPGAILRVARWIWTGTRLDFEQKIKARLWHRTSDGVPDAFACVAFALSVDGRAALSLAPSTALVSLVSSIEGAVQGCEMSRAFPVDMVYDMGLRRL